MNINPIKAIYKFNKEAGLLDKPYDAQREAAYPIEEMLETFNNEQLADVLDQDALTNPKELSRRIISLCEPLPSVKPVDYVDKHIDAIIFSFGSLFKLGLSPQQAMRALYIVMEANMTKLKVGQDAEGKQLKPDNFVGPEAKLQKILDEISNP